MNSRGVTLIELMIVVSIIGILIIALAFSYQGWQGRYKVEGATKTLYTDLMAARSLAMTKDHMYFADFPDNLSYRIIEDTDDSGQPISNGDTIIEPPPPAVLPSTAKKSIEYAINWSSLPGITLANAQVAFDKRGMIWIYDKTAAAPIALQVPAPATVNLSSTSNPDYDCITLTQTRVLIGQTPRDASNNLLLGQCNAK